MIGEACGICQDENIDTNCSICIRCVELTEESKWAPSLPLEVHQRMADVLGGPVRSLRKRWKNLERFMAHTPDVDWARLDDPEMDPVRMSPFPEEEEKIFIEKLENRSGISGYEKERLEEGFLMSDGTLLSFVDGRMWIDGRSHEARIPTEQYLLLLMNPDERKGWDLTKLFLAVSGLYQTIDLQGRPQRYMHRFHRLFGHMERELLSPFDAFVQSSFLLDQNERRKKKSMFQEEETWTHELMSRLSGRRPRQRIKFARRFIRNNENKMLPPSKWPWVQRWAEVSKNADHSNVSYPFMVSTKGVLSLRTLSKNGSVRRAPIPFHPGLLAGLISWGSSPHASKQGEWLIATQMNWSSAYENAETADVPFRRSMQFLRGVLEQFPNDTWVHRDRLLVRGMLGHFYEIRISRGAHNAPFKIHGVGKKATQRHSICIHTGKYHRDIPIGDTIAIVVLSLLSDVTTAKRVNSLQMHLMTQPPIGFPQNKSGVDPRTFYKAGEEGYRFPMHPLIFREEGGPKHIDLNSLELMPDEAVVNDWRIRPVADASFDPPGHLNPAFDFELDFDEGRIQEGDFYLQHERPPHIERIRNNIIEYRNHVMDHRNILLHVEDDQEQRRQPHDDQFHRWYRTMPLVWEALSLQPIGHQVELGGVRGVFRMQGCRLRLTIRSAQEEDALRRMLEILGYRHVRYRELNQVYIRRDFPIADPRQALRELMQPMTEEFGFANIEDYILRFIEVGRPPDRMPEVDARLHANMVDFY
ncbi:MAG: hypothetical protein ACPGE8_01495 [Candidatus Poseidoniaceae archaeon]